MKKIGKGLYEQLKNNHIESEPKYTRKYLEEVFGNLFKISEERKEKLIKMPFFWKHNTWEENGEKYSSWSYTNGLHTLFTTGDGGKEEFDRIMKEEINKL